MTWIFLGVIALALIVLSLRYPKVAFMLLFALVCAGVILYRLGLDETNRSSSLISSDQIELQDPEMEPGYADSYNLSTRLLNNHDRATLVEFTLHTKMEDCNESATDCVLIGETDTRISLVVPPRQARDLLKNIYFDHAIVKGVVKWTHTISKTRSR